MRERMRRWSEVATEGAAERALIQVVILDRHRKQTAAAFAAWEVSHRRIAERAFAESLGRLQGYRVATARALDRLFDAASRRAVEQASRGALRMRWEGRAALAALQKWAAYRAPRRMPPANTVDALSLVRTMRVLIGLWKQWRADAVEYHREVIAATLRAASARVSVLLGRWWRRARLQRWVATATTLGRRGRCRAALVVWARLCNRRTLIQRAGELMEERRFMQLAAVAIRAWALATAIGHRGVSLIVTAHVWRARRDIARLVSRWRFVVTRHELGATLVWQGRAFSAGGLRRGLQRAD